MLYSPHKLSTVLRAITMLALFLPIISLGGCAGSTGKKHQLITADETGTIDQIIPYTAGNIRWHKTLYKEGWRVVSSSEEAIRYAKDKSIKSSGTAIAELFGSYGQRTIGYGSDLKEDVKAVGTRTKKIFEEGTRRSTEIIKETHQLGQRELTYSSKNFAKAWGHLIKGNLSIVARTEADRKELTSLPGNYYRNLKKDFSNINEKTDRFIERSVGDINDSWEDAFRKAGGEFRAEYDRSGEKGNSLSALGPILYGYLKVFYEGLLAPTSRTIVKKSVAGTSHAIFLPAAVTSVTGRTVQSAGLTVYYIGKTGINIVSPTIEGGLYAGMSILSLGSAPLTYITGTTVGAVNQVAFTAGAPAVGLAEGTAKGAADTAKYVGFIAYDSVKGATKVVINQASAGIVLGYNALTAIPMHLIIGSVDSAIFLAWDGPRLVIATAKGEIRGDGGERFTPGDLPVGTIVDMGKIRTRERLKLEIISEDPEVIKEVIRKIPCDLREKGGACE